MPRWKYMFFSIVAANHFRIGLRGGGVTAGPAVTVSTVCRGGGGAQASQGATLTFIVSVLPNIHSLLILPSGLTDKQF